MAINNDGLANNTDTQSNMGGGGGGGEVEVSSNVASMHVPCPFSAKNRYTAKHVKLSVTCSSTFSLDMSHLCIRLATSTVHLQINVQRE